MEAPRPAPQIIQIPTPDAHLVFRWPRLLALWTLILLPLVLVAVLGRVPPVWALIGLLAALNAASTGLVYRDVQRRRRARDAFLAAHPGLDRAPLTLDAAARWRPSAAWPKWLPASLAATGYEPPPTGRIVCLGELDPPEVGERRFEPYVVTATEILGRRLWLILLLPILLGLWWGGRRGLVPFRFDLAGFTYPLMIAIAALVTWLWTGFVRPTYLRLAPGIVQVMRYRLGWGRPTIRSYRMEAGTLVVVRRVQRRPVFFLERGGLRDTINLNAARRAADIEEHLWWALLSTAPIPRLSEDELVE